MAAESRKGSLLRLILAFAGGALTFALLLYGYAWWAVGRATSDMQFPKAQVHRVTSVLSDLQQRYSRQARGSAPRRMVDYSTVGKPVQERRLREAAQLARTFYLAYGRNPTTLSEVKHVVRFSKTLKDDQRKELDSIASTCHVWHLGADSEVYNCDGWMPTPEQLSTTVEHFDPRVERYYLVGAHVVLYVPPRVHDTPMPTVTPPR